MNQRNPPSFLRAVPLAAATMTLALAPDVPAWAAPDTADPIVLSEDGSWCWFQDERAVIDNNRLLVTGVTSRGANTVTVYDFGTGDRETVVLNDDRFRPNDHNVGALLVRPDGRYLCVYAGHNNEPRVRYRISTEPGNPYDWQPEQVFEVPVRVTYSNIYRLEESGITYNFFRGRANGYPYPPHYLVSSDDGDTWTYGGKLLTHPDGIPYLRYASHGRDTIHFVATPDHPRFSDNNIYHGYIRDGAFHASDGTRIGPLSAGEDAVHQPAAFTRVFEAADGDAAWTSDIRLDAQGRPYIGFTVTKDPVRGDDDPDDGGFDHRYHYARWDGETWHEREIAYAGTRLYPAQQYYTGLIALHPRDPDVVYISADVDPDTNEPLLTGGEQRYEIFRGDRQPGTGEWQWTPVTKNSPRDNLRPIVVADADRTAVLWLHGRYTTYIDYHMEVRALIDP